MAFEANLLNELQSRLTSDGVIAGFATARIGQCPSWTLIRVVSLSIGLSGGFEVRNRYRHQRTRGIFRLHGSGPAVWEEFAKSHPVPLNKHGAGDDRPVGARRSSSRATG